MLPYMPQELVEAIVEEVPPSSLGACALTTKSFLDPSQRRIFRCLDFYTPYPPANHQFDALCFLLCNSPHLAPYVRAIVIRLHPNLFSGMARLLRVCSRLHSLAICFTTQVAGLDSSSLPVDLIDALLRRMASTSLDRLEIWGQTSLLMPLSMFHFAVASVRTLALRRVKIKPDTESTEGELIPSHPTPAPACLQHLIVDLVGRLSISAERLIEYRNFGLLDELQKLTLVSWSDRFAPLLEATANTLRELRVDLAAALWQGDAEFPQFAALRVLEIRVPVDDPEWDNTEAAPTIQRLVGCTPLLERLTIFYNPRSAAVLRPRTPPSPWPVFDVHHPTQQLTRLRAVTCCLCFPAVFQGGQAVAWDSFPIWVEAQMPGLRAAGLLTCSQPAPPQYASWDAWP
ncbi:hypothetical protein C8R47DRAFT_1222160 [Mycena vitilis]|nr:hypothetical protein C8R47DRAFT_1222160 [Mycena vitilis]